MVRYLLPEWLRLEVMAAPQAAMCFETLGVVVEYSSLDLSYATEIIVGTRVFALMVRQVDPLETYIDPMAADLVHIGGWALDFKIRSVTRAERVRTDY